MAPTQSRGSSRELRCRLRRLRYRQEGVLVAAVVDVVAVVGAAVVPVRVLLEQERLQQERLQRVLCLPQAEDREQVPVAVEAAEAAVVAAVEVVGAEVVVPLLHRLHRFNWWTFV